MASGRTLTIKGAKKVIRHVQRKPATTHSFTVHVVLRADGEMPKKLSIILHEPQGVPRDFEQRIAKYKNLSVRWSTSGWMTKELAQEWMLKDLLPIMPLGSCLIIDSWKGYKKMLALEEVNKKQLEIIGTIYYIIISI